MKYIAIIDTDDYKDFKFFEDANGKYLVARDDGADSDEWIALHFTESENMTKEEREKAIDALKISAPVMAVTQEEFTDYIQTLNQVMNWLEQEPETVTEFADQCRKCGARYGKLLKQEPDMYIPFLMHKEMDIPISECKKAYDIAIDYLRSQANVKG